MIRHKLAYVIGHYRDHEGAQKWVLTCTCGEQSPAASSEAEARDWFLMHQRTAA